MKSLQNEENEVENYEKQNATQFIISFLSKTP